MNARLYCIFDIAAGSVIGGLLAFSADAAAIRYFTDGVRFAGTIISQHPTDFELRCVGELALDSGSLSPVEPYCVLSGKELIGIQGTGPVAVEVANG